MLKEIRKKEFTNGVVYALGTEDDYPIEVTDTFLPYYTKNAIGRKQNCLTDHELGSRSERWMIGVSCMSGCPVGCKFCATGNLKKWRALESKEIVEQVLFVINKNASRYTPADAMEFKINYTRMGEPFLNITEVREAIDSISNLWPNTHHYISTIGIKDSDFSWIKGNTTLQLSVHSLDSLRRDWLIPYKKKLTIEELGSIRTKSRLKTTVNLTLPEPKDFNIEQLRKHFDKKHFFIKISPVNINDIAIKNGILGVIEATNLV